MIAWVGDEDALTAVAFVLARSDHDEDLHAGGPTTYA